MTIYLTGDTHGLDDIGKLQEHAWTARDWRPTADDYLIITGDVACVYHTKPYELPDYDPRDLEVIAELTAQPWTVLFVDGNHENHDTLNDLDVEVWHGGLVHRVADRLVHLMRGQVYDIDGVRVFAMGGAHSPDWMDRVEGESWWAAEFPDEGELDEARASLAAAGREVDVVVTHTCPTELLPEALDGEEAAEPDGLTDFLQELYDWRIRDFAHWFFGHFHRDLYGIDDGRFTCLQDALVELDPDTFEPMETE